MFPCHNLGALSFHCCAIDQCWVLCSLLVFTDTTKYSHAKLVLLFPGLFIFSKDDVYWLESSWNIASNEQAYIDERSLVCNRDRCFHWLSWRYVCNILMWSGVVFSWVCKRDFGWCIFIFLESWMDGSITFLVLIEFVPTTLLTCRSTSGVSTSSCSSKASARVWARIWSLGDNFPTISGRAIMYLSFLSIWSQS